MRSIYILIFAVLTSLTSLGQTTVQISPMSGYHLGGFRNFFQGRLNIDNNINYNLTTDINFGYDGGVELSYSIMNTIAHFDSYTPLYYSQRIGLNVHYMQVGAYQDFGSHHIVKPFAALGLGATVFDPTNKFSDGHIKSSWHFSMSLGAGVKFFINEHIGFRFQGRLLLPFEFTGVGIHCGIGSGSSCGLGLNSSVVVVQGDFSGGLIFAF